MKTWDDYEQGCLTSFAGGHHEDGHLGAYQHGMQTVFSLLRAEFPPAELCKAAPELLAVCKRVLRSIEWDVGDDRLTDEQRVIVLTAVVSEFTEVVYCGKSRPI